jgi:hypothetical protein
MVSRKHLNKKQEGRRIMTFNEMRNENAFVIAGKKLAEIPVTELFVDAEYQRVEQSNVNKIAKKWNEHKCSFLQVSYRPDIDKYAIMDGQNRWMAAKKVGVTTLPCQIYENLSIQEEAKFFNEQDDNVARISSADKFKSLLVMGDETCLLIKSLCDEFGIAIRKTYGDSLSKTRKNLNGLTAARRIVESHGINCLRWIFTVIEKSGWDLTAKSYTDRNFQVLISFYRARVNKPTFAIDTANLITLYANVGEYNGLVNHANKFVLDRNPRNDKKAYSEREANIVFIEHMLFNK